jgi:hypothetical protein
MLNVGSRWSRLNGHFTYFYANFSFSIIHSTVIFKEDTSCSPPPSRNVTEPVITQLLFCIDIMPYIVFFAMNYFNWIWYNVEWIFYLNGKGIRSQETIKENFKKYVKVSNTKYMNQIFNSPQCIFRIKVCYYMKKN